MDGLVLAGGGIIGFAIIMYVILDGFDLGIGILLPFVPDEHDKAIMISTIIQVWDGNQTWLVLGAACLYGAFPTAFSAILPVIYFPILAMLIALILRGVAFEFRLKSTQSIAMWDNVFLLVLCLPLSLKDLFWVLSSKALVMLLLVILRYLITSG